MTRKAGLAGAWLLLVGACFGGGTDRPQAAPTPVTPPPPPITRGAWTYYGTGQGLSGDVQDVSADEGGNVYVAGGDALYAKRKADQAFLRFDSENAGLTKNCNDFSEILNPNPPKPFYQCRVLAVAGAAPGKAVIGFEGFGYMADAYPWALRAGGADVVSFDPEKRTASRSRHVFIASPPHVVCGIDGEGRAAPGYSCSDPNDVWWTWGRRLVHRIRRIAVNHDRGSPMYGDAWLAGDHGTFSVLLANADARGLWDRSAGWGPDWADAKDVWEHHHPNIYTLKSGWFLNDEAWALSLDPRDGKPWGSNGFRTAYVTGYGPDLSFDLWGMEPYTGRKEDPTGFDIWKDPIGDETRYVGPGYDNVRSMSHCPDGTLWIGSPSHGLARIDPSSNVTTVGVPAVAEGVSAVACDPTDGSIWIGPGTGGVARFRNGVLESIDATGLPEFASHSVQSIQIDRWSTPRIVYFAFAPIVDATGKIERVGGVASYSGP